jgi:hypothetical protein
MNYSKDQLTHAAFLAMAGALTSGDISNSTDMKRRLRQIYNTQSYGATFVMSNRNSSETTLNDLMYAVVAQAAKHAEVAVHLIEARDFGGKPKIFRNQGDALGFFAQAAPLGISLAPAVSILYEMTNGSFLAGLPLSEEPSGTMSVHTMGLTEKALPILKAASKEARLSPTVLAKHLCAALEINAPANIEAITSVARTVELSP